MHSGGIRWKVFAIYAFCFFILYLSKGFAQGLPEGLVFHVTFDGCQVVDETGHVSQFEIHGRPQCVPGIKGNAFYFDGDDWIGADTFFPIADGTIILFVKFSQMPSPGETWFLIDSKTNFRSTFFVRFLEDYSNPIIRIGYPDTDFSQTFINKWLMLAIVYSNGNTSQGKRVAYLNGHKIGEQIGRINEYAIPWYANNKTQNLNIGVSDWYEGFLRNAALDEIMFFDRPLSQDEIQQIYNKYTLAISLQDSFFWDFDSQDGWTFLNDSRKGASFCPDPYSNLIVEGGIAHLHSHSGHGIGKLIYSFDTPISPQEISIGYDFSYSSRGSCGRVIFSFFDNNDQEILRYDFNYDEWGPYSWFRAYFKGQKQELAFDPKYKAGIVKWQFQNGLINLYWNDQLLTAFPYEDLSKWKIARINLTLGNPCCDGRNDSYLDIDFVKIVPAQTGSPENNHPPTKPRVSGPSEGTVGQNLSFSASASDPDGDPLSYQFDWGDGSPSSWGNRSQSHSWSRGGRYCVKVRAKDSHGATSEWSDCLNVSISPPSTNPQLLAYYSFDQCDIHDDSGNGHDGWSHGDLGCVDGVKGKALYFDGASWVDLPDFFEGYPYVSVCAWIKKENLHSGRQSIIDGWKDAETFHISWSNGNTWCGDTKKNFTGFQFGVHPGHPVDEYDPERHICGSEGGSEDWTFVCGVFDGQTLYLYENAQLISTYSYPDYDRYLNYSDRYQWNRPGPDLRLGISRHNDHFFTGYLDELRIYNYPLSQSEIEQLYQESQPVNHPPTIEPEVDGPESGYVGESYVFFASAIDPDGDPLSYQFDWGDGRKSDWGYRTQNHVYSKPGHYCIRVRTRDNYGTESSWSNCHYVTITVQKYTLEISKEGSGVVYSSPSGINCGHFCSAKFEKDSSVILKAVPDNDFIFSGWGEDCSECQDNDICTITLDNNKSCIARFEKITQKVQINKLYYENKLFQPGSIRFVCEISDENINDIEFVWEFKKASSLYVDKKITKVNTIFYRFKELANYTVTCKIRTLNGKEIDDKTINFSFPRFLAEHYAPIIRFSARGDKSNPELAQYIGVFKSLLDNLLPQNAKVIIDLTEDFIFKQIPEYEYFYPTSIKNFLKHLSNGCLDKNYLNEVKGHIDKQQPLTVYYYIKDTKDKIILEYWMFYLYNDLLDYPISIIDYVPFNHEGDWEGLAFILNKTDYTIDKAIFYKHIYYEMIDGSQVSWIDDHPVVFVALGTHASYPNPGANVFLINDYNIVFDRHYGEYISLFPDINNGSFEEDSYKYILTDLKNIEYELKTYYKWGCDYNSPISPLFQGEKVIDPYAYINRLRNNFPDLYLEKFQFYTEGNYIVIKIIGKNRGLAGIGYLSLTLITEEIDCLDIRTNNAKCYDKGEQIWCSYGQEKCSLNYPHIEKVKRMEKDDDISLEIKIPKNKIPDNIFYIDIKFIASDLNEQHWVYATQVTKSLHYCDVLDQQNEHAFRTFVYKDGHFKKYLHTSYTCYDTLHVPVSALYYEDTLQAFIGLDINLSTFELESIRNIHSSEIDSIETIPVIDIYGDFSDEIGKFLLEHVVIGNSILGGNFNIFLKEGTIKLDLQNYWFEN